LFTALRLLPVFAFAVACAPQDVVKASRSAQFEQYPERLFNAFETGCAGPAESFSKTSSGKFECSELLPADASAFLILKYNGTPQELPKSVTQITSTKNTAGYRVDADMFFLVPQKTGPDVKVPVVSSELDENLQALYRALGGSPI